MEKIEDRTVDRKDEKHRKHKVHEVKDGSCIENNVIRRHDSHSLQLKNHQDKVLSPSFFPCYIMLCVLILTLIHMRL